MKLKIFLGICSLIIIFCCSCADTTIRLYQGNPQSIAKISFWDSYTYRRSAYRLNTHKHIYNRKIDGQSIEANNVEILPGTHEIEGEVYGHYAYDYTCTGKGRRYKIVINLKPGYHYYVWGTRAKDQSPTIVVVKSNFDSPSLLEGLTGDEYQSIPEGKIDFRCSH